MTTDATFLVQLAAQILAPSGVVIWAVKLALNGTRERVKEMHEDVKATRADVHQLREIYHTLNGRVWLLEEHEKRDSSR